MVGCWAITNEKRPCEIYTKNMCVYVSEHTRNVCVVCTFGLNLNGSFHRRADTSTTTTTSTTIATATTKYDHTHSHTILTILSRLYARCTVAACEPSGACVFGNFSVPLMRCCRCLWRQICGCVNAASVRERKKIAHTHTHIHQPVPGNSIRTRRVRPQGDFECGMSARRNIHQGASYII